MHRFRHAILGVLLAVGALFLSSCSSDALFGSGRGAQAAVTTPSGVQSGLVNVVYTLTSEDVTETDITVTFSEDGTRFREATGGSGGEGRKNLSVSAAGDTHTFVWDSGADLDGSRASSVVIRIQPQDGTADESGTVSIHNARFLCAIENRAAGRLRFYSLDTVEGSAHFIKTYDTGGTDPYDVVFDGGFFFIAHRTTNDVTVFHVDDATGTLTAAEGSPFSADGSSAKYLATDGHHVFVSNTTSGTVSILDLDSGTGKLTLNANSGVSAAGCRSLAVRSARLYVASEPLGEILIFDISSDGELLENGASPVSTGGLASPRAMVVAGTRLYAANASTATLCGFNFQGDGSLATISGAPFTVSSAGIEQLARNGSKLFAATGAGAQFLAMTIDAFGAVSEDSGSPGALTGPSFTVQTGGAVVVAGTTTSKDLETRKISQTGTISVASSSPIDASIEVIRIGISD